MSEKFETWAVVELFGHKRIAGKLTEQEVGGTAFVRVDVPQDNGAWVTHYYGQGAIYAFHPVTEEVARGAASHLDDQPVHTWDFPEDVRTFLRQKSLPYEEAEQGDEDYDQPF